jgi:hypothetical protein
MSVVCERLVGGSGRLTAIDRSPKMVEASGTAQRGVRRGLEGRVSGDEPRGARPRMRRFDVVLAVRVGLFHRDSQRARTLVAAWFEPTGRLHAVFNPPSRDAR